MTEGAPSKVMSCADDQMRLPSRAAGETDRTAAEGGVARRDRGSAGDVPWQRRFGRPLESQEQSGAAEVAPQRGLLDQLTPCAFPAEIQGVDEGRGPATFDGGPT